MKIISNTVAAIKSKYCGLLKNVGRSMLITTSRITPPPIAVTVASVKIPKMSIFFWIALIAPDAANTIIPMVSRAVIKSIDMLPQTIILTLCSQIPLK